MRYLSIEWCSQRFAHDRLVQHYKCWPWSCLTIAIKFGVGLTMNTSDHRDQSWGWTYFDQSSWSWYDLTPVDWSSSSMMSLPIEWWSHRFDHGWYWLDIDKHWSIIELSRSSCWYKSWFAIEQQQHLHVYLESQYSIASNSTSLNLLIQCWLHRCELCWGCPPIDTIDSTADLNSQASIAYVDDHA